MNKNLTPLVFQLLIFLFAVCVSFGQSWAVPFLGVLTSIGIVSELFATYVVYQDSSQVEMKFKSLLVEFGMISCSLGALSFSPFPFVIGFFASYAFLYLSNTAYGYYITS